MREILFKAKRTDNRGWVEGYYAFIDGVHYIYTGALCNGGLYVVAERFEVVPSTLCQYTGLTDKNGKKIWENNICIIHSSNIDEDDGCFTVEWDGESARFVLCGEGLTVDFDNIYSYECEVVGNIFDNPELLGGHTD